MTEDEQEALSCKYVMPRVMRLTSGRFALIQGDALTICEGPSALVNKIPTYEELPEATRSAPSTAGKIKSIDLAELGLT